MLTNILTDFFSRIGFENRILVIVDPTVGKNSVLSKLELVLVQNYTRTLIHRYQPARIRLHLPRVNDLGHFLVGTTVSLAR